MDIVKKVAQISSSFEKENSDLKRQYIVSNIILYNTIASMVKGSLGTFGTGYPFYILNKNLDGALPVIQEQLRYNQELVKSANESSLREWVCKQCLTEKGHLMPDLKQICKICPAIENALKPRKLINRLPDLDMWMVCNNADINSVAEALQKGLKFNGFITSDVDPLRTIYELDKIVQSLQNKENPIYKLPIDTHIIDNVTLYTLISDIPDKLDYCFRKDQIPYLPILPLSLRKTWKHDDEAYNFVHDYLSSLTEFSMDPKIQDALNETRKAIAKKYSFDTLYKFLIQTGPESVKRRHETPGLKEAFRERVEEWQK